MKPRSTYSILRTWASALVFLLCQVSFAQVSVNMGNGTTSTCNGTFYDSGGPNGSYQNSESYTMTICSDNGQTPYLVFTSFSVENSFEHLYIYDGPNTASALLGTYTGSSSPGTVAGTGTCLTIVFTSDGSVTDPGWVANIGCGTPPPPPPPPPPAPDSCQSAAPFCTGNTTTFPAGQNSTAESGPSYGCLGSEPNPAWYYMQIGTSGNVVIGIAGTGGYDVDFICWGPFTSPTAPCGTALTGSCSGAHNCTGNIIDCSYSSSATETCTIPNGVVGQYYLLLITNFSNQAQNISFSQSGGTGATNCGIVCPTPTVNTATICPGGTATLTATGSPSYTWAPSTGLSATTGSVVTATPSVTTTYTVVGTGTCTSSPVTTTVTVSASFSPTVNSDTICAGGSTTLTAAGGTSYTWSPATGLSSTSSATVTANPPTTTVYTITAQNGNCLGSSTATVTVVQIPTLTVNSPTVCQGTPAMLTVTGAPTYSWSPSTGLSATTGSNVVSTTSVTTIYTVTGSAGTCTSQATSTVTVNTPPAVIASSNSPRCVNQNLSLTATATGGIGYLWNGPSSYSSTVQNPVITSVTQANAGVYTVTAVDGNGCVNSDTANVVINPLPVVVAVGSTVCVGATIGLSANNSGVTYSWQGPTSAFPGGSFPNSNTQNPTIPNSTINMTGSYIVTVTDANGCSSGNVANVVVNPSPTVGVNSGSICSGKSVNLVATGAVSYNWSPSNTLSSSVGSSVAASPATTTTYVVIGTDANGCMGSASSTVTVNTLPVVAITPTLSTGCLPVCATFTANSTSTGNYSWNFGDGNTSTGVGTASNCFYVEGNFTPLLVLTDNNGCVGTASTSVIVFPVPTADFYMDPQPTTILDPHINFTDQTSGAVISNWFWSLGDPMGTTATTPNVSFTYPDIGSYLVMLAVASDHNCTDTVYKTVVITDDFALYVPNAFSPNGDGVNEYFMAKGEGIKTYKINIFDKWGNLVYTGDNIDKGWDGTFRGKGDVLAEDVYVWKIEVKTFKNDTRQFTGTVTMIK